MSKLFHLKADYKPTGDQPQAIEKLVAGVLAGKHEQVLLGATGTGKTFTIANVIEKVNKPTLIFSHNKTLAAQLYSEFKVLFPNNAVEYFVSNFDYYQPEAYMPKTDTYIEKNAVQNDELDMLRMSAYNSLLARKDTIVIASVACIYAASNPKKYEEMFFGIKVGEKIDRQAFLRKLIQRQYVRNDSEALRGSFKVLGDVIEIIPGYTKRFILRVELYDDEIERISEIDPLSKKVLTSYLVYTITPPSGYAREKKEMLRACLDIEEELENRLAYFTKENKLLEKQRLEQRTRFDLEALREIGMVAGIENYSMHIDGRKIGQRPYNLFDYFPDDYLIIMDESHVSLPQIRGMYNGDRARKQTLVDYGFRLPSALENRPMRFAEFEALKAQRIYMSATPGAYELSKTNNEVVEQIIRPTGLLDPLVYVRETKGQIDDLINEVLLAKKQNERVLVTTLTIKMAEDLTAYLKDSDLKVAYMHHESKTLERSQIIVDLRKGIYDVLVGINLLREGLDIPEVALIAILNADSEGFLRDSTSLIQTIGRAARNENGRVIMYADKITASMQKALDETKRRRQIQVAYNKENNIIPHTIYKEIREAVHGVESKKEALTYLKNKHHSKLDTQKLLVSLRGEMKEAAKQLEFERAAELRDIIAELESEVA